MHSWVYRNHSRLRLIYGSSPQPQPQPPVPELAPAIPGPALEAAGPRSPARPAGSGRVVRGAQGVLLHPMPSRRM